MATPQGDEGDGFKKFFYFCNVFDLFTILLLLYGRIAQLVEQSSEQRCVGSSNLSSSTKNMVK